MEDILTPIFVYLVAKYSPPVAYLLLVLSALAIFLPIYGIISFILLKRRGIILSDQIKQLKLKDSLITLTTILVIISFVYLFFLIGLDLPLPRFIGSLTHLYDVIILGQ